MPEYDFHQLSPYDLEILARDLLQAHWGVTLESFKVGRDGGVDLRYAPGPDKTIVQVKHYLRTGLNGLLRDLKVEAVKARRLQPRRYVLVTSVSLSPSNKDEIIAAIGADILKPMDVLGAGDLNNLLGQHPSIEGGHFKLWLASRAILDRVIHNAAVTLSEFKVQQVYEKAKRYVAGNAYPEAMKMLQEERVVIIAGPPGVGKTTLADLLLYSHLERGYQAVLVQRDIKEGARLFQPGVRQIFYFDDFMGATFSGDRYGAGTGVDDRALLDFIAMVRATPTARLILTTREHVYAQALDRSERLRQAALGDLRVLLAMPSYTERQRACILYNHLYFSDLPTAHVEELLRDDFYLKIVKHEKFNPRLIEWLSSFRRLRTVSVEHYRAFVENLLRDPSEIWRHAYEQELTEAGRSMLLSLWSLGGKSWEPALLAAFSELHAARAARHHFSTRPEDFGLGLSELANSFIKPTGVGGFEVIDPSVLDLLNAVIRTAPDNAADIVAGAAGFDQIGKVWTFAKAHSNGGVLAALGQNAWRVTPTVARLAIEHRRIDLGGGAAAFRSPSYERRLVIILEMADRLGSSQFLELFAPTMARLVAEWQSGQADINDGVELLRALDVANSLPATEVEVLHRLILGAILIEARTGCRVDELRELLSVVDTTDRAAPAVLAAQASFAHIEQHGFYSELRECRSDEQFDGLIEDLELFRDGLGVNVDRLIERVEEARAEFEEHADEYADHMQDEWKERSRFDRDGDRSISEMFSSLRGDRD
ncbi:restriction endonuclease [Humitalea sp. 24SJ18S-53]|uniref:nSTAND3 domain-containing NTPase n=1 Tax=Humitalea sp. 24SJ18S-53 TaxID=3422307 RepID=UPI003D665D4F